MATRKLEMKGHKFGKLTFIGNVERRANGHYYLECECECGEVRYFNAESLRNGHTASCGCGYKTAQMKAMAYIMRVDKMTGVVAILVAMLLFTATAIAHDNSFQAKLTFANEVAPPNVTIFNQGSSGRCHVRYDQDAQELHYELHLQNVSMLTQAHLHLNVAGVRGPVFVFLTSAGLGASQNPGGLDFDNGMAVRGIITNASIIPTTALVNGVLVSVSDVPSVVLALQAGQVYCEYHTVVNPSGEARGQLQ